MMEPNLIFQTGEAQTAGERKAWIVRRVEAAREKGSGFFRASFDPEHNLTLLECWQSQPEDPGEPRWQMTAR